MRAGLWVATGLALSVGFAVPQAAADADLLLLLRFMAGVKALMALGGALLIDWRLRRPIEMRTAAGYLLAAALMAVSPGLIWGMALIVLGAVCFHAGLLLGAAIGWADRAAVSMLPRFRPPAHAPEALAWLRRPSVERSPVRPGS